MNSMKFNRPKGVMGMMSGGRAYQQGGKQPEPTYAGQFFSPIASDADFRDYVLYLPDYSGNVLEMTDMDFKQLEDAGAERIYLPTGGRGQIADKRMPLVDVGGRQMLRDDDFKTAKIGDKTVLVPGQTFQQGGRVQGDPIRGKVVADEGEVMKDPSGRDYVNMEINGELVKVYSDDYGWGEVEGAAMRDEQGMGKFMSISTDVDYPVVFNEESGEYQLDAGTYDQEMTSRSEPQQGERNPPVGNLLKQMSQMGPQRFEKSDGSSVSYPGREYGDFNPPVQRAVNRGMRPIKRN